MRTSLQVAFWLGGRRVSARRFADQARGFGPRFLPGRTTMCCGTYHERPKSFAPTTRPSRQSFLTRPGVMPSITAASSGVSVLSAMQLL